MQPLAEILEEHHSLAAILHAVRFLIAEFKKGACQPDFDLLTAMVDYLDQYAESSHHPKEDICLFSILKGKTSIGGEALVRLEEHHRLSGERINQLKEALRLFRKSGPEFLSHFADAFDRYAEFYRNHMILEEREAFPLVRQHFDEQDWAEATARYLKISVGKREADERFRNIYSRIVSAAPQPIGLGAGPFVK